MGFERGRMMVFGRKAYVTLGVLAAFLLLLASPAWAQTPPAQTTLTVAKSEVAGDKTVTVGEDLSYTIEVRNTGNTDPAQTVVLTDPLPANTTFVSAEVTTGGGTCTSPAVGAATGTITCNLGDIAPNTTETVEITVRPTAAAGEAGSVENTATADGANTTPASDTERTTVEASDITIEKDDSPDPADVDESLRYTLTVTNNGAPGSGDRDLNIVDELPDGVDFISADDRCTESNNVVRCRIDDLGPGETATVRIFVEPLEEGTLVNAAQVFARDDRFTPIAEATESTLVEDSADPDPDDGDGGNADSDQTNVCNNVVNIIIEDVQNPSVNNTISSDVNATNSQNVSDVQSSTIGAVSNEQVVEVSNEQVVDIAQELNISPTIVQNCIQQNVGEDVIIGKDDNVDNNNDGNNDTDPDNEEPVVKKDGVVDAIATEELPITGGPDLVAGGIALSTVFFGVAFSVLLLAKSRRRRM